MGAFFSGTDDANENASQFYGVWGKIKDNQPQFAFRYCSGDAKVQCCPSVLFDWPMITERTTVEITSDIEGFEPERYVEESKTIFKGPFPKIEYPEDWMGQHSKSSVTVTKPTTYGAGKSKWGKNNSPKSQAGSRSLGGASRWDDFDDWEEEYYRQASLFEYPTLADITGVEHGDFSGVLQKGIDYARIQRMMNHMEDNSYIRESSQIDIDDITTNYKELGLDRVIEASIDAINNN